MDNQARTEILYVRQNLAEGSVVRDDVKNENQYQPSGEGGAR